MLFREDFRKNRLLAAKERVSQKLRCRKSCLDAGLYLILVGVLVLVEGAAALAHPAEHLEPIVVIGDVNASSGIVQSASRGSISSDVLASRPLQRVGQVLESVPGMIATQHSAGGKANQYFLRGFNLDHGTDFKVDVDGAPVNLVSHAHGQGYSDMNFVIPELIDTINFSKGTYYADLGDFSSAGGARISLVDRIERPFAKLESGSFGFARAVTGASYGELKNGVFTIAGEGQLYDGPWDLEEDLTKGNLFMKYTRGATSQERLEVTALAYRSFWNSPDQIPLRAVQSSLIDRTGSIDTTLGGRSYRYGLTSDYTFKDADTSHHLNAFAFSYGLDLFSNFTYFLDDPINGDQFRQTDRRFVIGASHVVNTDSELAGVRFKTEAGLQYRSDFIPQVSLRRTAARQTVSTVSSDSVREHSLGLYVTNGLLLSEFVRLSVGARGDMFAFDVASNERDSSAEEYAGIVNPKFGITFGPWRNHELYINGGGGFHSNDARAVAVSSDLNAGEDQSESTPLVRSRGAEVGARLKPFEGGQSTIAFWYLELDSELVFVGDAGGTEATRASRRSGVEFTNSYHLNRWAQVDAEFSLTDAEFVGDSPDGNRIPGSLPAVVSAGLSLGELDGLYSEIRLRYFGKRPLIEDNSARSQITAMVNARVGYRFSAVELYIDGFNIFDRRDNDVDYFYASRLPGEPNAGVEDIHFHPVEPLAVRAGVVMRF